jgi:hypothetical protein
MYSGTTRRVSGSILTTSRKNPRKFVDLYLYLDILYAAIVDTVIAIIVLKAVTKIEFPNHVNIGWESRIFIKLLDVMFFSFGSILMFSSKALLVVSDVTIIQYRGNARITTDRMMSAYMPARLNFLRLSVFIHFLLF